MISSPSYSCVTVKSEKEYENAKLKYPYLAKELFLANLEASRQIYLHMGYCLEKYLTL